MRYALTCKRTSSRQHHMAWPRLNDIVIISDDLLGGDMSSEGVCGAFYLEIADFSVLIIIVVKRLQLVQWEFPLQSNMHYWNILPRGNNVAGSWL